MCAVNVLCLLFCHSVFSFGIPLPNLFCCYLNFSNWVVKHCFVRLWKPVDRVKQTNVLVEVLRWCVCVRARSSSSYSCLMGHSPTQMQHVHMCDIYLYVVRCAHLILTIASSKGDTTATGQHTSQRASAKRGGGKSLTILDLREVPPPRSRNYIYHRCPIINIICFW